MRDHPLQNLEGGNAGAGAGRPGFGGGAAQMRIDTTKENEGKGSDSEEEEGGIEDKLKAVSSAIVYLSIRLQDCECELTPLCFGLVRPVGRFCGP